MLRVFKASGEEVLATQLEDFAEMIGLRNQPVQVMDLKRHLQGLCKRPRFQQRLLDPDGQILADDAVLSGPMDMQLVLLAFSPSSDDEVRRFYGAACMGDIPTIEELLNRPQDPNLISGHKAPLFSAVVCGCVDAVRLLLEACADKDWADSQGVTPMLAASSCRHDQIVRLLLEAKADKDKTKGNGETPMFVAAKTGADEVVQMLLEANADKDKGNASGETPMLGWPLGRWDTFRYWCHEGLRLMFVRGHQRPTQDIHSLVHG